MQLMEQIGLSPVQISRWQNMLNANPLPQQGLGNQVMAVRLVWVNLGTNQAGGHLTGD